MKQVLRKTVSVLILLAVLLCSGCWQDETETPTSILQSDVQSDQTDQPPALPEEFALSCTSDHAPTPLTSTDATSDIISSLLYEGLFQLDERFIPQPVLCATSHWDAESLTYAFTPRSDVRFSDGSALTPQDVADSLKQAQTSRRYGARLSDVLSVSADDSTVRITLKKPNAALPALLDIPVVKSGTAQTDAPVGTGPYLFLTDKHGPYLQQNNEWWQDLPLPLDRIALVEAQNTDAALYHFTSHETQLMTVDLTGSQATNVTGSIEFHDVDTPVLQYIGVNTRRSPLSDPALRRALSSGIDRISVVTALLSGHGKAVQFPLSPASPLYPTDFEKPYARADFNKAMADAGYSGGSPRSLIMIVNDDNAFKVSTAKYIASALSAYDLKVSVDVLPWEEFTKALQTGRYDLYYGETRLTADWDLRPLLESGGTLNFSGYSNETLDQLLVEYAAASDRSTTTRTICQLLQTEAPIFPICFKTATVLTQKGVVDQLTPTETGPLFNFPHCTIQLAK